MTDPVRAGYDAVAADYARELAGELAGKPVDRAMYALFADLLRADLDSSTALGTGRPRVGDAGCGPGHVTAHLHTLGLDPVGVDLSPAMVAEAARRFPHLPYRAGSMLDTGGLGEPDGAWAGAVAAYAVVHFGPDERAAAFTELARAVRDRGWLLLSFHTADDTHPPGTSHRVTDWFGHPVDLTFHYLDPVVVTAELAAAGFTVTVHTERAPWPGEVPTRRCHLLARRSLR